jgi:hypothetical protein
MPIVFVDFGYGQPFYRSLSGPPLIRYILVDPGVERRKEQSHFLD